MSQANRHQSHHFPCPARIENHYPRWTSSVWGAAVRWCTYAFCILSAGSAIADCTPDMLPEMPNGVVLSERERLEIARALPAYIDLASVYGGFSKYTRKEIFIAAPSLASQSPLMTQTKFAPVAFLKQRYRVELDHSEDAAYVGSKWAVDTYRGEKVFRIGVVVNSVYASADASASKSGCMSLSTPVFVWWISDTNAVSSLRVEAAISNGREFRPTPGVEYTDRQLAQMRATEAYNRVFTDTIETEALIIDTSEKSTSELVSLFDKFSAEEAIVAFSHCAFSSAPLKDVEPVASLAEELLNKEFGIPLEAIWFQGCIAGKQDIALEPGQVRIGIRARVGE